MQFPLYKLFLMMAAYSAALGPLAYMGTYGVVLAAVIGTSASAFILVFRAKDLVPVIIASLGTLVGAIFGFMVAGAKWTTGHDTSTFTEVVIEETVPVAITGLIGALIFSYSSQYTTKD